jgi:hypothetical protein
VGLSGQILRWIKIAAYVFAGLLVWMVVREFTASPPEPAPVADSDPATEPPSGTQGPSTVPPPPPLPGQASRTVRRTHPVAKARVESQDAVHIREVTATETPHNVVAESGGAFGTASSTPGTLSVNSGNEPAGIVIVAPPVRTTQESRGRRWVRAVGRVLHIGSQD